MSWRSGLSLRVSVVVLILLTGGVALAQPNAFQTLKVDGHAVATYRAVEPHMRVALDQMSDYSSPCAMARPSACGRTT